MLGFGVGPRLVIAEWIDVSLGMMPNVTADLLKKAFYPADERVSRPWGEGES